MTIDDRFPVYEGNTENYLKEMEIFTERRRRALLLEKRDVFDSVVKVYWHTKMITGIIHSSFLNHHENDSHRFTEAFKKWAGIWVRLIESENILQDSMILGLEGRTTSASNLLRPAVESIVTGVFFHYFAQEEYRKKSDVMRISDTGKKSGKFFSLIENALSSIEDKSAISIELERQVTRKALESEEKYHLPSLKKKTEQIEEWGIIETEGFRLLDFLYHQLFHRLSSFSHSLHETSYAQRGLKTNRPEIMFGWATDPESFEEYYRYFRTCCVVVLIFFLAATEDLQKTASFKKMITRYFRENPDVHSLLGEIPNQILTVIGVNGSIATEE